MKIGRRRILAPEQELSRSARDRTALLKDRLDHNTTVIQRLSMLAFPVGVMLLVQHLFWPGVQSPHGTPLWSAYTVIFVLAGVVSPSSWLIFRRIGARMRTLQRYHLTLQIGAVFVAILAVLAVLDSSDGTDTSAFILGIVIFAPAFRGRRIYHLWVILTASVGFLLVHWLAWGAADFSSTLTVAIAASFGTWIARTLESRRVDAFLVREELNRQNRVLAQLSATDPLTGVMNRRTMAEHLRIHMDEYRRYGTMLSVVMIDVDHFKDVNDRNGHQIGDQVLTELAELLTHSLRTSDEVARYGGEEFVLLLPHTPADRAVEVAERIRASIGRTPFSASGLGLTASFGVTEIAATDADCKSVFERADQALYAAKSQGRDRVVLHAPAATGMG